MTVVVEYEVDPEDYDDQTPEEIVKGENYLLNDLEGNDPVGYITDRLDVHYTVNVELVKEPSNKNREDILEAL
jgi:hypothetical protein